jgi:hypothetical protein
MPEFLRRICHADAICLRLAAPGFAALSGFKASCVYPFGCLDVLFVDRRQRKGLEMGSLRKNRRAKPFLETAAAQ